ncbi:hypothetical protein GOBAR_AA05153 [Gossypium barbadense]|uniref:Uncharacterized protein n=1 Tax=Gossypium barbadense TaxID=3634 RepID=A0A2P5YIM0_GOSBA|nr:hypothetical protein GOBAR_AA05153 [Gossypium barbadense]
MPWYMFGIAKALEHLNCSGCRTKSDDLRHVGNEEMENRAPQTLPKPRAPREEARDENHPNAPRVGMVDVARGSDAPCDEAMWQTIVDVLRDHWCGPTNSTCNL